MDRCLYRYVTLARRSTPAPTGTEPPEEIAVHGQLDFPARNGYGGRVRSVFAALYGQAESDAHPRP